MTKRNILTIIFKLQKGFLMIKRIFYSYSHSDEKYLNNIKKYLKPTIDKYGIEELEDRHVGGGEKLMETIWSYLDSSDLIILLISANYLASDACKEEMKYAVSKNRAFPIILSQCEWKDTIIKDFKVLPKDGKPIKSHSNSELAYHNVAEELKKKLIRNSQ